MNDRHCREIGGIKSVPRIAILLRPEFYPVEDFYRTFDRIYYSYVIFQGFLFFLQQKLFD